MIVHFVDIGGIVDNQLYNKTKIICKKRVTCKKKQGDFNFDL
jgi:hypothetical protein